MAFVSTKFAKLMRDNRAKRKLSNLLTNCDVCTKQVGIMCWGIFKLRGIVYAPKSERCMTQESFVSSFEILSRVKLFREESLTCGYLNDDALASSKMLCLLDDESSA